MTRVFRDALKSIWVKYPTLFRGVFLIVLDDRYGYDINLEKLEQIKKKLTQKDIELIFVNNDEIAKINEEFRGIKKPTDVLSFPLIDMPNCPLGTIIISIDKVKEMAVELGHRADNELTLLFIHGLLHLLGYDHEEDNGDMRKREKELIDELNLPKSLILRSE